MGTVPQRAQEEARHGGLIASAAADEVVPPWPRPDVGHREANWSAADEPRAAPVGLRRQERLRPFGPDHDFGVKGGPLVLPGAAPCAARHGVAKTDVRRLHYGGVEQILGRRVGQGTDRAQTVARAMRNRFGACRAAMPSKA